MEWVRNSNINIVKWNTICTSIQDGGLEVKNFLFFNQALLGKRLWLYVMEENAFWRKMINTKYGISRGMVFQCGWKVLWSKSLEILEEVRIASWYLLDLMWEMVLRFFYLERYIWNRVTILEEGILSFSWLPGIKWPEWWIIGTQKWNSMLEPIIFSRNSLLGAGIYEVPFGLFIGCQNLRGRGG